MDEARLGSYLRGAIPNFGHLSSIKKFKDGQSNPTYLLVTDTDRFVLRRKPSGALLKSAHAVDREFRVMRALADTPVPVPGMLHLCEDDEVIGTTFFVMTYVDGRVLWNPALGMLAREERGPIYDSMVQTLAALHQVDLDAVGLIDYGRSGNYYARQISRWSRQYWATETERIESMESLITWLEANTPEDDGRVTLIHGDFRIDNLILSKTGPEVLAVIDWELSTLGHPFADLAYQCMALRMPSTASIAGLGGLNRTVLGIPEESAYVEQYARLMGIGEIPNWPFYIAFSFFRLAAILQGVRKRALDGNASSEKAAIYGAMVGPLAELALKAL